MFCSIWTINRTLLGATTPGQSGPWSEGNKGVLCIPQSLSITGTSPSDCLVLCPGHSLVRVLTPLQRCSRCILQSQPTGNYHFSLFPTQGLNWQSPTGDCQFNWYALFSYLVDTLYLVINKSMHPEMQQI